MPRRKGLQPGIEASGIPVHCAFDELVDPVSLIPNPRNPNRHPDHQIELLARVIKAQGWRAPVTVSNRSGFVVRGHGRLQAALRLGVGQVPVDRQDYATEAEEWADLVADNRLAELAEVDEAALKDLLRELETSGLDMDLTGFDEAALEELLAESEPARAVVEDQVPEPPQEPVTKPGDLWLLGKHRLLCGDSTNPDDVRRLMNGERAILFATDPPYLVGYDGTNHPAGNKDWSESYGITWDDGDANSDLYDRFIRVAVEVAVEPNAAWYCWHASRRQRLLEDAWEGAGAFVHQQIIWHKPNGPILTRCWYMWTHEPCFFGWLKGNKPPRQTDEYQRTVWVIDGLRNDERPDHPTPNRWSALRSRCSSTPSREISATNLLPGRAASSSLASSSAGGSTDWRSPRSTAM